MRLLFVCLGNICRSPTAEGVMRSLVEQAGLREQVELDSAGTGGWHVGSPPDRRAYAVALAHGVVLEGRARQVTIEDFQDFDLVLAMDSSNMRQLRQLAPGEPERSRVRRLREFDPLSRARAHAAKDRAADGARATIWTCPTRTTAPRAASRRSSRSCARRARACCRAFKPAS